MGGHTPWEQIRRKRVVLCDCGHDGLDWWFHDSDCPWKAANPRPDTSGWEPVGDFAGNGIEIIDPATLPDDAEERVKPVDDRPWTTWELRSARSKAQGRAKTQLAHEFRARYRILYRQELEREGLTVIRHRRVGWPASKTVARERAQQAEEAPVPFFYPDDYDKDQPE